MNCKNCGKPIMKYTHSVYVKQYQSQYDRPSQWSSYHYFGDNPPPKNIADCRKLTNLTVISVSKQLGNYPVTRFNTWDGISYQPKAKYFCGGPCVKEFAVWCVESGITRRQRAS